MRVNVYDKNPGPGFSQWFLKTTWLLGCFFQKLFGAVDDYYGASSWEDAFKWLESRPRPLTSIQYWGHGSPGTVWLAGKTIPREEIKRLAPCVATDTIVWFRTCSTFQGVRGRDFSELVSDTLNCTVAGHTRIIGPLQGGLHTRKPNTPASWPIEEGEFAPSWIPPYWRWGNHTVTALATKIPEGW